MSKDHTGDKSAKDTHYANLRRAHRDAKRVEALTEVRHVRVVRRDDDDILVGQFPFAILVDVRRADEAFDLVAVGGRDAARTRAFADDRGIPHALGVDELLTSDAIDLLYIATTHDSHVELARRAIERDEASVAGWGKETWPSVEGPWRRSTPGSSSRMRPDSR